jgi:tRNA dimethylallyltransferase
VEATSDDNNRYYHRRLTLVGCPPAERKVLVLVGPTASGKTTVALTLAAKLDGEIISADSRQVYKLLTVGTAKPSLEDRATARHHFVDDLMPDQEFTAGAFGVRGRGVIDDIFRRGKTPLVVGGSGLYVQSLIDGLFEGPGADPAFRVMMEHRLREGQIGSLIDELRDVDPAAAEKADPSKPRRIIRALEVYHLTGVPISRHHSAQKRRFGFTPVIFGLAWHRETLYKRVEMRCDWMIAAGLLEEVEQLESRGYDRSLNALNTVGYAEAFAYRRGEISYTEFVRLFKRNSRRYAKRQLTWFGRDPRIHWVQVGSGRSLAQASGEIARLFLD